MNKTITRESTIAKDLADDLRAGHLSRREFLSRVTALGIAAPSAIALTGGSAPAAASPPDAGPIVRGGVLRMQMNVLPLKDIRTADWSEIANLTRGTMEYLVRYHNDGRFTGHLLDHWTVDDAAQTFSLFLRPGITWSNGDPLTANDILFNFTRWCDRTVPGNSMAARLAGLIDPITEQMREDAVRVVGTLQIDIHLSAPDITLIPTLSDYPAAVVHPSYDPTAINNIGTGPYVLSEHTPGNRAILTRRTDRPWWGTAQFGGPYLDQIEYIDKGTDPANWVAAMDTGQVDCLHETVGVFVDVLDRMGFDRTEVETTATVVVRPNQMAQVDGETPYADVRMRRALALAVDNQICLELGFDNRGSPAENHHASPMHPEYAPLPPVAFDPAQALALVQQAGLQEVTHVLTSIDDDWHVNTADAVAAQLQDAGLNVQRQIVHGDEYWAHWQSYPFSVTAWNHRPLAVQIWTLAYRSNAAWNEFGWNNPEFDALLDQALTLGNVRSRQDVARKMEKLLQQDAVTIQPYWRALTRHSKPGLIGLTPHVSFEHHHDQWGWASDT